MAGRGSGHADLGAGGTWARAYFSSRELDARLPVRRLTYWLYAPAQAGKDRRTRLPLVVMLHGCEQTAPDFAAGTRMNALALQHGFAVLYPQQSAGAHSHRCWPWYKRSLQRGGDEAALIGGAIEKVMLRPDIDHTRIYVAGLSAGAALAQTVALQYPHLIAAIGSHSGPVYGVADSRMSAFSVMQHGSFDAARAATHFLAEHAHFPPMPILILQGAQDHVVRPVNAAQLANQFCTINGLSSADRGVPTVRAARGSCDAYSITEYRRAGKTLLRLCEVRHLAHAWSGGDASLRYNAANGPDASTLLWNFFKRHRRLPGAAGGTARSILSAPAAGGS